MLDDRVLAKQNSVGENFNGSFFVFKVEIVLKPEDSALRFFLKLFLVLSVNRHFFPNSQGFLRKCCNLSTFPLF